MLCFSGGLHTWVVSEPFLEQAAFDFDGSGLGFECQRMSLSNVWLPSFSHLNGGPSMLSLPLFVPAVASLGWTLWLWRGATRASHRFVVVVGGAVLLWWLSIAARMQYFGSESLVALGGGGVQLIERHDKMPTPGTSTRVCITRMSFGVSPGAEMGACSVFPCGRLSRCW